MPEYDLKTIKKELSKQIDEKRYEHTIGVADTAAALAMKYHIDVSKAYLAGLLHDCAKCLNEKKRMSLCEKYGVKLSKFEIENQSLIHAKLGVEIAKERYSVEDKEILESIRWHTTGKENMSMLEMIIFSADYIEPNRKKINGLDEIRSIIFDDIEEAVYLILNNTINHLDSKKQIIDESSLNALNYYKNIHDKKNKLIKRNS